MAALALRNEERIGLGVAIAAHAALVALILLRPGAHPVIPPPERMTVTLSDDVGLTSTAPSPSAAEPAPDVAPQLGEPAPVPPPAPVTEPSPAPQPPPVPQPRPLPRVAPMPRPQPSPHPVSRPAPHPQPSPHPVSRPASHAAPTPPAKRPSLAPAGGSRVGADFLKGAPGANGRSHATPAAAIGPAVQASLRSEIARQLKPHWIAPQGADAELLVTLVRFHLNRDGSLAGDPEVIGQSGVTPSNAPQKARHAEQAIRAIRLAAPFKLPAEFYSAWQTVTSRFDRKLSQ